VRATVHFQKPTPPAAPPQAQPGGLGRHFTRIAKFGAGLLTVLYLLGAASPAFRSLVSLVPGRVVPCLWMLVTASFVEQSPVSLAVSAVGFLFICKPIEQVWGSREYARFVGLCAVASTTTLWVLLLGGYALLWSRTDAGAEVLFAPYGGFVGVTGGLLVGLKQVMPDTTVKLLGVLKVGTSTLPFAIACLMAFVAFVVLMPWYPVFLFASGAFWGWFYLRFFQPVPGTALRGDQAEAFRFATLFPGVLQAPVDAAVRPLGPLAARLRARPEAVSYLPLVERAAGAPGPSQRLAERGRSALAAHMQGKGAGGEAGGGGPPAGAGAGGAAGPADGGMVEVALSAEGAGGGGDGEGER